MLLVKYIGLLIIMEKRNVFGGALMVLRDFSFLVQDVVISAPCGIQMLARQVGKTYPALMREVNPYDRGAKLGADTLLRIMEVSRDVRPLEYMARLMGMRLERAQGKPSGE